MGLKETSTSFAAVLFTRPNSQLEKVRLQVSLASGAPSETTAIGPVGTMWKGGHAGGAPQPAAMVTTDVTKVFIFV